MEHSDVVLPRLLKIQLFSDFDLNNPEDKRILLEFYNIISIKKYKKGESIDST